MKLLGTILLAAWLILMGLFLKAYIIVDVAIVAWLAIITGVVIILEVANVIEK